MKLIKLSDSGLILISIFMAMGLRILPLENDHAIYNPDWVAIAIIFWCIHLPNRFGIGLAWLTGLLTDVLTGRPLGGYALCYSIIAYLSLNQHRRLNLFPVYQQALFVLIFLLVSQFLIFWSEDRALQHLHSWRYYLPSLSGTATWPFISIILNWLRHTPQTPANPFNNHR